MRHLGEHVSRGFSCYVELMNKLNRQKKKSKKGKQYGRV